MRERCYDPSHDRYSAYGGRGITVCERWLGKDGFVNFLADMGTRPYGKTIDRINVNGNYYLDNCRWATKTQQYRNRRKRSIEQKQAA